MTSQVWDPRACHLGEGALWHPLRQQLFWFDILGNRLLSRDGDRPLQWQFDERVSAAGWIDERHLLIASESGLQRFDLQKGQGDMICALEADNPQTRSNDGRADPWGGFWIGTMGKQAQPQAGAIYRYYRGEVRQLFPAITITNAICFSPDRRFAYFADTARDLIWRQALEPVHGWPQGDAEIFIDTAREGVHPDGAVVDSAGRLWNAQWGAARVACYSPQGAFVQAVSFSASQISCPCFGGAELRTLFATSAQEGMSAEVLAAEPDAGRVFVAELAGEQDIQGQAEHQVVL
ncbi:SMP-30/gluconolactonase/LRE family protein [Pokkaliibacter sp. MBI-7]|uniref:SMP-30/gluconolactonase/LRE family protein n=1 Tax=Pokkaliibacter sp. MBI-7 TaxID=3040600 RepID=UPI002448CEEB|nr:SMP-30/gluconolactonase/LRE family protein [Pokkaliibacter sp. MBI-7]MDH2434371.1 SMP-30/gluconolactonase/LRE family protein [Pokkaliibacter sp. MBI-7]